MTYKPLPTFENIDIAHCPRFSNVLEVGANWLTKEAEHLMGWPYDKTYTHAMIYLDNGRFLSMGFNANIITVDKLSKSHIYTVISYIDLTENQIIEGIGYAEWYVRTHRYAPYDVMGYLGFLTRIVPAMRKITWLHGSDKLMFCSDLNCHMYQHIHYPLYDNCDTEKVAPTDLFLMNQTWPKAYFNNLVI